MSTSIERRFRRRGKSLAHKHERQQAARAAKALGRPPRMAHYLGAMGAAACLASHTRCWACEQGIAAYEEKEED